MAYTKAERKKIIARICERVALGESVSSICQDNDMPNKATVMRWFANSGDFATTIAHARGLQAETFVDMMLDIAKSAANPVMVDGVPLIIDGKPVMQADSASVAHAKLQIDTLKWVAGRMKPKKYGDKYSVEADIKSRDGSMSPRDEIIEGEDLRDAIRKLKEEDDC